MFLFACLLAMFSHAFLIVWSKYWSKDPSKTCIWKQRIQTSEQTTGVLDWWWLVVFPWRVGGGDVMFCDVMWYGMMSCGWLRGEMIQCDWL